MKWPWVSRKKYERVAEEGLGAVRQLFDECQYSQRLSIALVDAWAENRRLEHELAITLSELICYQHTYEGPDSQVGMRGHYLCMIHEGQ